MLVFIASMHSILVFEFKEKNLPELIFESGVNI